MLVLRIHIDKQLHTGRAQLYAHMVKKLQAHSWLLHKQLARALLIIIFLILLPVLPEEGQAVLPAAGLKGEP